MVKKIVIAVGVLIAAVLVYAAFQPNTFLISRSVSINAAPGENLSLYERLS